MNKKGFTLVELILVIVIIGIIGAITIPGIMDALKASKTTGGETVEKILEENLKIYNKDNEQDLWCLENTNCTPEQLNKTCNTVTIQELYNFNPDINMGDCVVMGNLIIAKNENDNGYSYHAKVICSKDKSFSDAQDKTYNESTMSTDKVYYKTQDTITCN